MATYNQINSKMIEVTVGYGEQMMSRRGAMLAYKGDVRFVPQMSMGQGVGGFVGRMVAGEQVPMMMTEGNGTVLFGHNGMQTKIVQVTGESLYIEADKLLCYDGGLQAGTMFLGQQGGLRSIAQGAMTGQGLFTTVLSGHGTAVMVSHGPVFDLDPSSKSVAVDPQAYVGHQGNIDVKLDSSVGWRDAVGKGSGEAFQLKCSGHGTVYVQASEKKV